MSKDPVKLYKRAMLLLQREKAELEKELSSAKSIIAIAEKRLSEIESALGEPSTKRRGRPSVGSVRKTKNKTAKKTAKKTVKKTVAKRTLKDVVLSVTKGKSLDAKQIFDAVSKSGHKLGGKNPMNSIRVLLYTNKKLFKNKKGRFTSA